MKDEMKPITEAWFKELKRDIELTQDEVKKQEQIVRFQEMYKNYEGEDRLVSSLEILKQMKERPPIQKIHTGIPEFDKILDGFVKKQLVVLAAPTKNGKTSFAIDLTIRLKEHNPMWLPFEEPAEELIQKFVDRGEEPPLFYTPSTMKGNTLAWVEKKIVEARAKFNTGIVFIDHLHFIVPFSAERQDLEIGRTMRELKRQAKAWNVVIVLIAHLKKTKLIQQPDLEDLRDSSFIAQEADTVIMLWRKTKRNDEGEVVISDEVNVSVQANRRTGRTGNIKMLFDKGRFIPLDKNHHEPDPDLESWESCM